MLEHVTFFEFLVALCMGLAALCFFFWAIMEGAFKDVEEIKYTITEIENHER
jgi:cbb3-type cytochrome oxidase maturation protein